MTIRPNLKQTVLPLVYLALAFLSIAPGYAAEKQLKLALEHWPPYIDRYADDNGLAADLVTTALKRAGYSITPVFEDWSLTLRGTEINVYDVIAAGWYTESRERDFVYSEPYLYNRIKFVKRRNAPYQFRKLSDLRGLVVGTVSNYAYSPAFDKSDLFYRLPQNHLIQNLSLLQLGKIDLTLDDERVIRHQINTYLPASRDRFKILEKPLDLRALHVMVSRSIENHQQIVDDFNKAMSQMKADGTYQKIVNKYPME